MSESRGLRLARACAVTAESRGRLPGTFLALGHYGQARDVAGMVAYLAGPGGRHVTGSSILVDGGCTA